MLNFGSDFDLLQVLKERAPLIVDGAPETYLQKFSNQPDAPAFGSNLTQPELVEKLHSSYLRAGAEILRTNTSGANPLNLEKFDLKDRAEAINNSGMASLRKVVENNAIVAGQITGITFDAPDALKEEAYAFQSVYLSDTYADLIWLDEFPSIEEIQLALKAVRQVTHTQVVANLRLNENMNLNELPDNLLQLQSSGANFIGLNVHPDFPDLLKTVEKIIEETGILCVMLDEAQGAETPSNAFQKCATKLIEAEVALIGGGKNTSFQNSQFWSKLALS